MNSSLKMTFLILLIFIIVGIFYYFILSSIFQPTHSISQNSYLVLNIYGELPEIESTDPITEVLIGERPSLNGLLHCIRKAENDDKIKGIILRPLGSAIGWAKTEELKNAIRRFKASGKPVYAYFEMAGNREYYLAIEADMVIGPPSGALLINGLSGSRYYFKGILNKIGVEADFVTHGKYKSYPDMFTRDNISSDEREEMNALLDDYFYRYTTDMSKSRGIPADEIKNLINLGLFDIDQAHRAGLVDTVMYYTELKNYLNEKTSKRPNYVSYQKYKKIPYSQKANQNIAVIYLIGDIVSGLGSDGSLDGIITSQGMADIIRSVANNHRIKAIILRINSPGGSAIAADVIWREIVRANEKKPVIASISDVAASGGYYIAMNADTILAQAGSIVGSIGVFSGKFSFANFYQKFGINKTEILRGKNADLFSEISTFSAEQRTLLQNWMDKFYREFVTKVADGRDLDYTAVDSIAQGRVWSGRQAVNNGLVDRIGGLQEAVDIAKGMLNIPEDQNVNVQIYPVPETLLEKVLFNSRSLKENLLIKWFIPTIPDYLRCFHYFFDYEPLYLLPFYVDIR